MKINREADAWDEYVEWQAVDRLTLRKINQLITDIQRQPFTGPGKPEPLKHDLSGYWSRRINEMHRLVYRIDDGIITIAQCRGHYEQH